MFSADICFEIFGRSDEYNNVDLDEPYSKSICNKSFYLQVVRTLSSVIFKHGDIFFSKYRPASNQQRDLFRLEGSTKINTKTSLGVWISVNTGSNLLKTKIATTYMKSSVSNRHLET